MYNKIILLILYVLVPASLSAGEFSLNGLWSVAIGDEAPASYEAVCPVPGIASQAAPALADDLHHFDSSVNYNYVWHRKEFTLDSDACTAFLMLRAKYNARVWLNGVEIGYNDACTYSHARFDLGTAVRFHGRNELVVRVGSWNTASFPSKENKNEWWRTSRCPGLIDDVWIELGDRVVAERLEVLPDVAGERISIRTTLRNYGVRRTRVRPVIGIKDAAGNVVLSASLPSAALKKGKSRDFEISIDASRLEKWTPGPDGNPVLYTAVLVNDGERIKSVRFGYRDVRISGRDVLLNGKKVHFAAENIAFNRTLITWADYVLDPAWVRRFLRTVIHDYDFNFLRMHLGHAPSFWYDIADEEGIMIQDEWCFMHEKDPQGENLIQTGKEFAMWVKENINHPSIIGWDMENEGEVDLEELSAGLRDYDPTRMWSEDDFDTQHRYEYSENIIPTVYCEPSATKPTTVLESCRLWINQSGELEPMESFKTSRTASSWGVYYYTPELLEQLQADIHADQGTYFRSVKVQAWAPFALLSGTVNGHNFFHGNIGEKLEPQRNLTILKALNQKKGASLLMLQAREWYRERRQYECGGVFCKPVVMWNDTSEDIDAEVTVYLENSCGHRLASDTFSALVPAYDAVTFEDAFAIALPDRPAEYKVGIEWHDGTDVLVGPERRVAVGCRPDDYSLPFKGSTCILDHFLPGIPDTLKSRIISHTYLNPLDQISDKGTVVKYTVYDGGYARQYRMTLDDNGDILSNTILKNKSTGWEKHAF